MKNLHRIGPAIPDDLKYVVLYLRSAWPNAKIRIKGNELEYFLGIASKKDWQVATDDDKYKCKEICIEKNILLTDYNSSMINA